MQTANKRHGNGILLDICITFLLLIALCSSTYTFPPLWIIGSFEEDGVHNAPGSILAPHEILQNEKTAFEENPIDFELLLSQSPGSYAWLCVPSTNINTPVLQHPQNDRFYLDHDGSGSYSIVGSVFTQLANSRDFSNPVTVLYGHTFSTEEVAFTELHKFEDAAFFDENDSFLIILPDKLAHMCHRASSSAG